MSFGMWSIKSQIVNRTISPELFSSFFNLSCSTLCLHNPFIIRVTAINDSFTILPISLQLEMYCLCTWCPHDYAKCYPRHSVAMWSAPLQQKDNHTGQGYSNTYDRNWPYIYLANAALVLYEKAKDAGETITLGCLLLSKCRIHASRYDWRLLLQYCQ